MEARCVWFKAPGVAVIENCSLGVAIHGLPDDYRYDCVVVDHKGKRMWAYPTGDKSKYFYWCLSSRVPINHTVLKELIAQKLSANMGLDIYDIIPILVDNFGILRQHEVQIAVEYVQNFRATILERLKNYIPASKIQRAWKRCITDPKYYMCEKRLLREFNQMTETPVKLKTTQTDDYKIVSLYEQVSEAVNFFKGVGVSGKIEDENRQMEAIRDFSDGKISYFQMRMCDC